MISRAAKHAYDEGIKLTEIASIHAPERLLIAGEAGESFHGADQAWYATRRQRISGCGPAACANALWYLSRTGEEGLCRHDASTQGGMLRLMEDVWRYVTPGFGGVNRLSIFANGAVRYGMDRGVSLRPNTLEISSVRSRRPGIEGIFGFLCDAFSRDTPVAFLNLSKGAAGNLEGWHWVTLISLDTRTGAAVIYDQGKSHSIDVGLWLRSSLLGGGMVALR